MDQMQVFKDSKTRFNKGIKDTMKSKFQGKLQVNSIFGDSWIESFGRIGARNSIEGFLTP